MNESDLLDPFERLITIEILGHSVEVPEKNWLLRCFQYLSLDTISYGDFCWNGDCANCQVWLAEPGRPDDAIRPALACRCEAREGMVITRLSPHIRIAGVNE